MPRSNCSEGKSVGGQPSTKCHSSLTHTNFLDSPVALVAVLSFPRLIIYRNGPLILDLLGWI